MSFCNKASAEELRRIVALVAPAVESCPQMSDAILADLEITDFEKLSVMVEEHIVSKELVRRGAGAAVVYTPRSDRSVMINEEDHIRIHAIEPGLQLDRAYQIADGIEDCLNNQIEFAFSDSLGYLTACPTNVGTGMRASAMLHLPGLVLTKRITELLHRVSAKNFAVRGFYGEGTDALGDFYQVSNQVTLGVTEQEIVSGLEREIQSILDQEQAARAKFMADGRRRCEDMIWRAVGTLREVRILSWDEFMGMLSHVRLGVVLGVLDMYDLSELNRLMIEAQPAHVMATIDGDHDEFTVDCARADLVRSVFLV